MSPSSLAGGSEVTRIAVVMRALASIDGVRDMLADTRDLEVVGGTEGLEAGFDLVARLLPDIVLVECAPGLVAFTQKVKKAFPKTGIILLSRAEMSGGGQDAGQIVEALASGAFDLASVLGSGAAATPLLLSKIRCCSIKQYSRMAQIKRSVAEPVVPAASVPRPKVVPTGALDAIVVGVSTGGPEALREFVSGLDASFPIPLVIVLHMPKDFTGAMAASLDRQGSLRVVEAQEGDILTAGTAYLAPGGRHCLLERGGDRRLRLTLDDGPAENGCRPSVDVLFRSAERALGKRGLAVVLTGMGSDGTEGAKAMKAQGARVLVQDEVSSVVWGMPGSAVRAGIVDEVLPLSRMAQRLREIAGAL